MPYDSNKNELEILKYWDEHKCFEKSVESRSEKKPYHFYDGPPFATGLPHYGHIVASLMKDVVPRFWTMRGYRVERKWGWDCHGLPVENIIEKDLNLNSKKDIEKFGVAKFNEACRSTVLRYAEEWKKTIKRMGRWVDMENDYKTMDISYMESVWWVFRQLWEKDLIYKGHKAMHVCPRCVTPLSNFEVTQGYKDVKDISVIAKFKITDEKFLKKYCGGKPTSFVAWTTTPWSIPTTMGLAVGADFEYVVVDIGDEQIICAKNRFDYVTQHLEKGTFKVVGSLKGAEMEHIAYTHPFDNYLNHKDVVGNTQAYKTHLTDYVSVEDGTGIVTINGAYGEIDYEAAKKLGLPIVINVKMDGTYDESMGELAGLSVKPIDDPTSMDVKILQALQKKGALLRKEKYTHSYPHCWRCDAPLLNYLTVSWFVKVTHLKEQLLKNNEKINWVPEHIKEGRFGQWLEGARDWAISRSRYWGTPLPVWENEDGNTICVGSVAEMAKLTGKKLTKIIFVRHGESEMNVKDIVSSELDKYPLTEKGIKETEEVVEKIRDEVDVIISSPVLRARETAEIITKKFGKKLVFDDLLSEYSHGAWEGKTKKELEKLEDYKNYKKISQESLESKFNFRLGTTGESRAEIVKRVEQFLAKTTKEYAGKTILVVSHGGINAVITKVLRGISHSKFFAEEKIGYNGIQHFYLDENNQEYDLHKHIIDQLEIKKDGKTYRRIPEVLDCWFESGSMPYGQMHYPFENKKKFESSFPAEFIAEGQDQTRGWFYTLHVLATALTLGDNPAIPTSESEPAFKNVIVNGIVLAEDGKKMSKRLKNYPEPELVLEKYGADAMRYYLVTSPVMLAEGLNFAEAGVREIYNKVINTLWNVVSFYEMYGVKNQKSKGKSQNLGVLDRWILAKLQNLVTDVTKGMEGYNLPDASRPILDFVTELSQWYVRRSRDRFKGEDTEDQAAATAVLHEVLLTLSKLMAPFTPFIAEKIYLGLTAGKEQESVHLEEWPKVNKKYIDEDVLKEMDLARKVVEMGLAARAEAGIKVRQPLAKLMINNEQISSELLDIIADELNVKEVKAAKAVNAAAGVVVKEEGELKVGLDTAITDELKKEGLVREIVRTINQMRKEQKLTVSDMVTVEYTTDDGELKSVFEQYGDEIKKSVLAAEIIEGGDGQEVEIDGRKIKLAVTK